MKKVIFSFAFLGFFAATSCSSETECVCETKEVEGIDIPSQDYDFETEEDNCYLGLAELLNSQAQGDGDEFDEEAARLVFDCEEK